MPSKKVSDTHRVSDTLSSKAPPIGRRAPRMPLPGVRGGGGACGTARGSEGSPRRGPRAPGGAPGPSGVGGPHPPPPPRTPHGHVRAHPTQDPRRAPRPRPPTTTYAPTAKLPTASPPRHPRRHFDLHLGAVLDQVGNLERRHRREMPADHFPVVLADLGIRSHVLALVLHVPGHA